MECKQGELSFTQGALLRIPSGLPVGLAFRGEWGFSIESQLTASPTRPTTPIPRSKVDNQWGDALKLIHWPVDGSYTEGCQGRFLTRRGDGAVGLLGIFSEPGVLPLGQWREMTLVANEGKRMEVWAPTPS